MARTTIQTADVSSSTTIFYRPVQLSYCHSCLLLWGGGAVSIHCCPHSLFRWTDWLKTSCK